jgi:hypothetical protein
MGVVYGRFYMGAKPMAIVQGNDEMDRLRFNNMQRIPVISGLKKTVSASQLPADRIELIAVLAGQ